MAMNQAAVDATTVATAGSVINTLTANASLIIREFFRAAMGSPILAVAAAMMTSDILEKQLKILSSSTAFDIKLAIGGLVGAEVVADVFGAVENGLSVFTGKGASDIQSSGPIQLAKSTWRSPCDIGTF